MARLTSNLFLVAHFSTQSSFMPFTTWYTKAEVKAEHVQACTDMKPSM
eukprot:CAMPEP_0180618856 /NCGR_PEP_ID=MMETSP1037_2-20121125/33788_1 /TAXON_ID=632150 /ORGANISM="Azadinium spinosum, Strain 3D9" /LENGTH=47 /DNA_ID= /DNA_START= /DNA_END= /DNA_ORIENTATION=